jgi:hypothetical protein
MDNIAPQIRDSHQYDRNKSRPSSGSNGSGRKRFSNDRNSSEAII